MYAEHMPDIDDIATNGTQPPLEAAIQIEVQVSEQAHNLISDDDDENSTYFSREE